MGNPGKEERVLLRLNIQVTVGDVHGPFEPALESSSRSPTPPPPRTHRHHPPFAYFKEMQKELLKIQGSTHLLIQWKEDPVWLILIFKNHPMSAPSAPAARSSSGTLRTSTCARSAKSNYPLTQETSSLLHLE